MQSGDLALFSTLNVRKVSGMSRVVFGKYFVSNLARNLCLSSRKYPIQLLRGQPAPERIDFGGLTMSLGATGPNIQHCRSCCRLSVSTVPVAYKFT